MSGLCSNTKHNKDFKQNLSNKKEYNNNTQESLNNNNIKNIQKGIIDSNIKEMNYIDSISNLERHCLNLNNLVNNKSNKNNNKNYERMQIIVSNTDSGQKKLSISPANNKLYIFQYNGSNKKNNKININIDEYNSKNCLNNKLIAKNGNWNKIINYTEYNKELQKNLNYINNNNKKESYTLLKSISFCKKINNPVKLYPKKKRWKNK